MTHNENCLAGIRCPKCKRQEEFRIECKAMVDVTDGGTDDPRNIGWLDSNYIECTACSHHGRVHDFTVVNWPIDAAHPLMVGEEVYFSDPDPMLDAPQSYVIVAVPNDLTEDVTDDVYADSVITLVNKEGGELEAYPADLSRLPPNQQPPRTTAATRSYTAMCQQDNGHGTIWMRAIDVPLKENREEELAAAKIMACRMCAEDWYGRDGVDIEPLIESITCMGILEGDVNVLFFDDSHIPKG